MRLRVREDAPGLLSVRGPSAVHAVRLRLVAVLVGVFTFGLVPAAAADGDGWWCHIPMVCETKTAVDFLSDPVGYIAQQLADANVWFLGKLLDLTQDTTRIDLTSSGFLKQYALIFAASTFLTVALWLVAVAKRAMRGVPLGTAVSEAVGFLVLQFVVNAFTPGAIALVVKAVDEITEAFVPGATGNFKPFLTKLIENLSQIPDTGVMAVIAVNLLMMAGALLMWVELLLRSAAIYVAVALAPLINAGLVDRDLWGRTKKWCGALFALVLCQPVLFALLGLGGAIMNSETDSTDDPTSQIFAGAMILFLAVFASAVLYRWLPTFGDEMASLHHARHTASTSGPASAVDGPSAHVNRAMANRLSSGVIRRGNSGGSGAKSVSASGGWGPPSSASGAGGAGGAVAAGAAVAKVGADLTKKKAAQSPGAQQNTAPTDATTTEPARARPSAASGGSVVPNSPAAPPSSPEEQPQPPRSTQPPYRPQPPGTRRPGDGSGKDQ